jgi:hypothetical protein
MKSSVFWNSTCLIIALSTAGVEAATIVQSQPFSKSSGTAYLTFAGFDTQAGALIGVFVELDYTRSGGYMAADNAGSSTATVDFTHTTDFQVDDGSKVLDWSRINGGTRLLAQYSNPTVATTSVTIGPNNDLNPTTFESTGADYYRFDLSTISNSSSGYFSNVAQFNDKAAFTVPVKVIQSSSIDAPDGAVNTQTSAANVTGTLTITYTYEPTTVPETSVALLSGLALTGGVFIRRRRQPQSEA